MEVVSILIPETMSFIRRRIVSAKYKNFTEKNLKEIARWTEVTIEDNTIVDLLDENDNIIEPTECSSRAQYMSFLLTPSVVQRSLSPSKKTRDWIHENCEDLVAMWCLAGPQEMSLLSISTVLREKTLYQDLREPPASNYLELGSTQYHPSFMFKNPDDAILFKMSF